MFTKTLLSALCLCLSSPSEAVRFRDVNPEDQSVGNIRIKFIARPGSQNQVIRGGVQKARGVRFNLSVQECAYEIGSEPSSLSSRQVHPVALALKSIGQSDALPRPSCLYEITRALYQAKTVETHFEFGIADADCLHLLNEISLLIPKLKRLAILSVQAGSEDDRYLCLESASRLAVILADNLDYIPPINPESEMDVVNFKAGVFQTAASALMGEDEVYKARFERFIADRFDMPSQPDSVFNAEAL